MLHRVSVLLLSCLTTATLVAAEAPPLRWVDAATLTITGQAWTDTARPFDRLPARAKGVVRGPVYSLGGDSTGLAIRFSSDTPTLRVRWTLRRERIAMNHMPATGVSGLDLYLKTAEGWRWVGVTRPEKAGANEATFFTAQTAEARDFLLYLPLYNGVTNLELGVVPDARLAAGPRDTARPIVVYGTSVVQGGCASRPGMAYPAILGRRFGVPVINLGFSGNGKAEPEMAELLATLDPAAYVIDTMGNLEVGELARLEPFLATLRQRHPATPIILVENIAYPDALLVRERRALHTAANDHLRAVFARLSPRDPNLHRVDAHSLIGNDNEATVDGSHPTDLGFMRIADALSPVLRRALDPR